MKKSYPSDKQDQYMIRFPDGMRDRIKEEADKNGRSMNAEIVARLWQSLEGKERDRLAEQLDTFMKDMREITDDLRKLPEAVDRAAAKADLLKKVQASKAKSFED